MVSVMQHEVTITIRTDNPFAAAAAREIAERLHASVASDDTGNWDTKTTVHVDDDVIDGWLTDAAEEDAFVAMVSSEGFRDFVASA